jgi:soluble lytic murein transglycosylase
MLGGVSPARIATTRRGATRALLIGLATIGAVAQGAQDPYELVRAEFGRAYAEAGAPSTVRIDSEQLVAYPLYPYLERARLAADLRSEQAARTDEAARTFLDRHAAEPVAAGLREVWLQSLAQRRDWRAFVTHYAASADPALRCDLFNARIALGDTAGLTAAIAAVWLTPQRLPPECVAPFDWLRAHDALDAALIEQRVRLLLQNDEAAFARTVAGELPQPQAGQMLQWADLIERPRTTIDSLLATRAPFEPEALLAGWTKLARNEPAAALERHERLRRARGLQPVHESRAALALALGLAWDRRAESHAAFAQVAPSDLDDYALEWRARAALWSQDWRAAAESIGALSEERRAQPRWRYWAARAAEQRGSRTAAQALYEAVLASDNYYSAMAAARLGRPAVPHPQVLPADAQQLRVLAARPGFVRTRELLLAGLPVAAAGEWAAAYAAATQDERLQLIHLAASWDWHDVTVTTATRQNVFFDYAVLYPQPYGDEVRAAADLGRVAVPLLYGVIRQESLFRADAVSAAGAMGLAQLRLDTARSVARQWRQPVPRAADLLDPGVNVRLAASYLRTLADRYGEQLPIALAAYNAGPNAAERWLPETPLDADVWIENIPYNETREYVQRVLWHSVVFGWLQGGTPQDTSGWLAPLARAGATVAAAPSER